ncbi:MAG: hypothetical protein ACLPN5_10565 [Roseiarcus sp.]
MSEPYFARDVERHKGRRLVVSADSPGIYHYVHDNIDAFNERAAVLRAIFG